MITLSITSTFILWSKKQPEYIKITTIPVLSGLEEVPISFYHAKLNHIFTRHLYEGFVCPQDALNSRSIDLLG